MSEALARPQSRVLLIGSSVVLAAIGIYAATHLEDLGISLSDADPSSVDTEGTQRLLGQLENGDWDPNDPNDFRKVIALLIGLGVSAAAIAPLVGMNSGTARRWASGQSVPAPVARRPVFEAIKGLLRGNKNP